MKKVTYERAIPFVDWTINIDSAYCEGNSLYLLLINTSGNVFEKLQTFQVMTVQADIICPSIVPTILEYLAPPPSNQLTQQSQGKRPMKIFQ